MLFTPRCTSSEERYNRRDSTDAGNVIGALFPMPNTLDISQKDIANKSIVAVDDIYQLDQVKEAINVF
ncbi:hypothetical protein EW026_g2990 [Hermanssonia centrifuga]|uniref:Uncharacterized protein n=1 Tax=Hermanssonia centrifuga TaxID=98765 RepID=A0A4S4KMK6_9APHY|nr:hypothetical protein EW026_g2990 [Hermanssonia centrifuga]